MVSYRQWGAGSSLSYRNTPGVASARAQICDRTRTSAFWNWPWPAWCDLATWLVRMPWSHTESGHGNAEPVQIAMQLALQYQLVAQYGQGQSW